MANRHVPFRPALLALVGLVALAACAEGGLFARPGPAAPGAEVRSPTADTPRPEARPSTAVRGPSGRLTAEGFDTSTARERVAAASATGGGALLGQTIASLGPPQEQGFWLRTGLVSRERAGRVVHPGTGASVQVTLRPSGREPGSGSQLSLAAFRLLGVPLTDLPQLDVYAGS